MNLTKRQEDSTCTLAATEVRDDGLTMHFESEMPNYGTVRFSLRIHSGGERGSGSCDGSARGRNVLFRRFSGSLGERRDLGCRALRGRGQQWRS
jgi:hypothetical protein